MANDQVSDERPGELPDPVTDWLKQLASEQGISEEDLLGRIVDGTRPTINESALEQRLTSLESSLRTRIDAVDTEFQAKLEDVRNRVIQVKRETDAKAPSDHRHDAITNRLETLESTLETLESDLEETTTRFDQGFENYEEILEYLTETVDEFDRKLDALATAIVDIRDHVETFKRFHARQQILDQLTATANRHRIRQAVCDSCSRPVDIGLLVEPRCPHCEQPFADVEAGRRFLGTHRLLTGTTRALEGEVETNHVDFASRFESIQGVSDPVGPTASGPNAEEGDLESIDGIGPEYARRLAEVGIETVSDLTRADPDEVADASGIAVSRIERWIDDASS